VSTTNRTSQQKTASISRTCNKHGHTCKLETKIRETYIGVELAYEAGEVVVLEVPRQQVPLKGVRVPDHEAAAASRPGDDRVGRRVGDHVVDLGQERRHVRRLRHHPHRGRRRWGLTRQWGADIAGDLAAGWGGGTLGRPLLRAHGDGRCENPRIFGWRLRE
jgi:hypothetical protein